MKNRKKASASLRALFLPAASLAAGICLLSVPAEAGNMPLPQAADAGHGPQAAAAAPAPTAPAPADTVAPENADEEVYTIVKQPPVYPGGETALLRDIAANVKYPATAQEEKIQGTVILRFAIEKDGSIGKVIVQRSLSTDCDRAAVEAVRKLKKFAPGKQDGKPVAVWFTLPVRFALK